MKLKVISFNIWDLPLFFVKNRKERIKRTAEYLKKSDADIICIQESFDIKNRLFLKDTLTDSYYMAGDTEETRRLLFFKLFDMSGGLVVFSKFPIIRSNFVSYSRIFNSALGEIVARKGFLEVILKTPAGEIRVLNTHLHEETPFFDRTVRLSQLAKMFGLLSGEKDMPTILTGDFNEHALQNQQDFSILFESSGFQHPFHNGHASNETPSYRPENPYVDNWINRTVVPKRFDYVLVKDLKKIGMRAVQYGPQHLKPELSDHDPILLELSDK